MHFDEVSGAKFIMMWTPVHWWRCLVESSLVVYSLADSVMIRHCWSG